MLLLGLCYGTRAWFTLALLASLLCCSIVMVQSSCSPTVVEVVVSSQSGATAADRSAGQTGHYDTPTGLFISPGDVLVFNGATTNSWCYNNNNTASCSNAQGFAPNGPASFDILTMALSFRYGNNVNDSINTDWSAVFPYTSGLGWQVGMSQQSAWTVPATVVPQSQVWLAVWDTYVLDNTGSAAVAITQTPASCPISCTSSATSVIVSSSSTATAAERSAGQNGHYDTPTGLFVSPGDVLSYTGALTNSWCYNTNTSTSCSNAQGFAPNGPASFGMLTMALSFRYSNASSDTANLEWFPVFPYSSGISWEVGSVQQFSWTVPLTVAPLSQLWLAAWDTVEFDNSGQAAVAITRTPSTCTIPCATTVVEVTVIGTSAATASERSAWQTGHYDTPTGLFVSPGDVLTSSGATANSWCYNSNSSSCSNAQGFAPNGPASFDILTMALVFRYGNNAADPRNLSWSAVFPYTGGNTWTVGISQTYTWTVPSTVAPLSQLWLAVWDTYQWDNTGSASVAITRTPASCPTTCVSTASSVVVESYSTATAADRAIADSGHYDTPTGLFINPGDLLTYTGAPTNSWCYNTDVPVSCSNAQGYAPNGLASFGILTIALAFRYGNATTDSNNTDWSAVFPYVAGNSWQVGSTQQSTFTVPANVAPHSQLWMSTWDTWQYDNSGFAAVAITRTPAVCSSTPVTPVTSIGVKGDPQFKGLRGQDYQVHGIDGGVYNIISEQEIQLNSRFVFLEGPRPCPVMPSTGQPSVACFAHPGSYLGNLALQTAAGDRLLIQSGAADDGFSSVTLNGQELKVGDSMMLRSCQAVNGSVLLLSSHELQLQAGQFATEVENSDSFLNIRRVATRSSMKALEEGRVHGLLGQTWLNRKGKSAIEGKVDDYLLESEDLFGSDFVFNRYKTEEGDQPCASVGV